MPVVIVACKRSNIFESKLKSIIIITHESVTAKQVPSTIAWVKGRAAVGAAVSPPTDQTLSHFDV
jgi:hypothetical protein